MQFPISQLIKYFKSIGKPKGIISIWGDIGVGKTTFSIHTAIMSALNGNKVLFIYSKANFPFEKVDTFIQNIPTTVLDNIIFIHSLNFNDVYTFLFNLEFIILNDLKMGSKGVDMIIIDSLTDLYRLELHRDKKDKNVVLNYKLSQILANLFILNKKYDIEILIVNDISRKSENGQTFEIQSGGKVMDYWINYSIKIDRMNTLNNRKFTFKNFEENEEIEFNSTLTNDGFE